MSGSPFTARRLSALGSLALLALAVGSCTTVSYPVHKVDELKDVARVEVSAIRIRPKQFEVDVKITNLHDRPILFFFREILCYRGDRQGEMDYPHFHIGKRTMNFAANQMRPFTWVCKFDQAKEDGAFKITLGQIFENENSDAKTTGKLLAKSMNIIVDPPAPAETAGE